MPEVKDSFRIADESDDYLWLCRVQDNQSGLEVPIPKDSPKYDAKIRDIIKQLDKNTTITATLVSENEQNTAWRIKSVQRPTQVSPASSVTV